MTNAEIKAEARALLEYMDNGYSLGVESREHVLLARLVYELASNLVPVLAPKKNADFNRGDV